MCGIVGAIAERNIVPILLEGISRLEYRGYDSAGLGVIQGGHFAQQRTVGKVAALAERLEQAPLQGNIGIAHTRWATHGEPSERNAHPHTSHERVAVVHNGIIENHDALRAHLRELGYSFTSDTDSEVAAHQINLHLTDGRSLLEAVQLAVAELHGAYALGVVSPLDPTRLIATRKGSPLVIGLGIGENFIASDCNALVPVTRRFLFLEEGDIAEISRDSVRVIDGDGNVVDRPVHESTLAANAFSRGKYRHFMAKEIHEQPLAIADTIEGRVTRSRVLVESFGHGVSDILRRIQRIQIIACGTSYHAGLVASYWCEDIVGIPCRVEVASEFRYRHPVLLDDTLMVTISQSGETADTLGALKEIKANNPDLVSLAICNVPESSLVRASDVTMLTHAGPEIGVASTKAFSTQLAALALLMVAIGKTQDRITPEQEAQIVKDLHQIPGKVAEVLRHEDTIERLAQQFVDKQHALFLGRGAMFPIALEGALKLKEISYIHAEAYPAGELKHGPLALVDESIPVVAIAPQDDLLAKLRSNLQEVSARGGQLYVFSDQQVKVSPDPRVHMLPVTSNVGRISAPIVFNLPLQLLAYHVAVLKGTDVDQPRNLAKSVTVE